MNILEAIILGLIQGITEWLPISSSGHLVLAQNFLNIQEPVIFDVILHLGSVVVIFMVFWKDIVNLIKGLIRLEPSAMQMAKFLIIASIPIVIIGSTLNTQIKALFTTQAVGISLIITAILLFLSKYPRNKNQELTTKNTIWIGLAQALAILPGISRSGATISTGLMKGVKREEAVRFSFLLAIPAILGAGMYEITNIQSVSNLGALALATIVTIITGFFTLKLLLRIIKHNKFSYFAYYCLALGIIILII